MLTAWPRELQERALRRLNQLDAAPTLQDLRSPGLNLEALRGERHGQFSIRITGSGGSASAGRKTTPTTTMSTPAVARPPEAAEARLQPTHPGVILAEDYLEPLELTAYRASKAMGIPQSTLSRILAGTRSITADTALRLGCCFGTSAAYWLRLQNAYDLATAEDHLGSKLDEVEQLYTPPSLP